MESVRAILAILAISLVVSNQDKALAQVTPPVQLLPSAANANQDFGFSVDIFGDVAVVGAQRDDDGLTLERGAAFVFRFEGPNWTEEAKLMSTTQNPFNWFGWDVSVFEDVILVAERNGDELSTNAGNVNVFRYGGGSWSQEAVLTPPSGMAGEDFGFAVDFDGAVAAVGAPLKNGAMNQEGAVYVFRNVGGTWNEDGMLKASDPGLQDLFGSSVAVEGNRIVVGALNAADSTSNQAGKTYVFDYDGEQWTETAILQSNQSNSIANMGTSVALDGDWIASGAPSDNQLKFGAGAVIVHRFDGDAWDFHSKLTASDGSGFFLFGTSVAVDDTLLVVGAENWAAPGGNGTGKVYFFHYDEGADEWVEAEGVVPDGAGAGDEFGQSVATHNGGTIAGAPDFGGPGAAFVYGAPKKTTAVEDELPGGGFAVSAPYPNPFNARTSVLITPLTGQPLTVDLFDILGRQVATPFDGLLPSDTPASIVISGAGLPNGMYVLRIESGGIVATRSVILSK